MEDKVTAAPTEGTKIRKQLPILGIIDVDRVNGVSAAPVPATIGGRGKMGLIRLSTSLVESS